MCAIVDAGNMPSCPDNLLFCSDGLLPRSACSVFASAAPLSVKARRPPAGGVTLSVSGLRDTSVMPTPSCRSTCTALSMSPLIRGAVINEVSSAKEAQMRARSVWLLEEGAVIVPQKDGVFTLRFIMVSFVLLFSWVFFKNSRLDF